MTAQLATAKVKLRLDINLGDPVNPVPRTVELPSLRPDSPPILILGYPIETVLAEKLVTAIELGRANTRVRDFVDIYQLTGTHSLQCGLLRVALQATAGFRGTTLIPLSEATEGLGRLRDPTYGAYRRGLGEAGVSLPERFSGTDPPFTASCPASNSCCGSVAPHDLVQPSSTHRGDVLHGVGIPQVAESRHADDPTVHTRRGEVEHVRHALLLDRRANR